MRRYQSHFDQISGALYEPCLLYLYAFIVLIPLIHVSREYSTESEGEQYSTLEGLERDIETGEILPSSSVALIENNCSDPSDFSGYFSYDSVLV